MAKPFLLSSLLYSLNLEGLQELPKRVFSGSAAFIQILSSTDPQEQVARKRVKALIKLLSVQQASWSHWCKYFRESWKVILGCVFL